MRVMVLVKATERSESGEFGPPMSSQRWVSSTRSSSRQVSCWPATDSSRPATASGSAFDEDGAATVIDGPFAEAKELVAGFWIWQVGSMDEAVEWIKRAPFRGTEIELRKILSEEDFGDSLPAEIARGRDGACAQNSPPSKVTSATQQTIDAVWRIESARLIAGLARLVRDVGLAEDLAQDALVAALEQWPESGVPDNPGAWLMAVARRRGVDTIRRAVTLSARSSCSVASSADHERSDGRDRVRHHVDDDVLRLMFTACHPVLPVEARVALTLQDGRRAVDRGDRPRVRGADDGDGGPDHPGEEGAHRREGAIRGARRRRAGRRGWRRCSRRSTWSSTRATRQPLATQWARAELCAGGDAARPDARRPGPGEPEAHALVALMEIQASRLPARTGPDGEIVTLDQQDRARWDRLLITHGLAALERARSARRRGHLALQAEIAACHARAPRVRGYRLGTNRFPVWRSRRIDPIADRRTQPRGGRVHGRRARRRARGDRRVARGSGTA